jgi:hypothetical protein
MIRRLVCLVAALSAVSSFAVEITVQGINGQKILRKNLRKADLSKSVGELTVEVLEKKYGKDSEEFEADVVSVTEIAGLRTKSERYSDGSVRAFGWCYTVNGSAPDAMADEVRLSAQSDRILWYYGSMTYSPTTGWENECRPVVSYGVY